MRVLGFMSGTSLDGVDAAIIETDGVRVEAFGPAVLIPFGDGERAALAAATEAALDWDGIGVRPESFAGAETVILATHVRAALAVLAEDDRPLDLIGFHGQTVLHRPERALSVQLGDSARLARALGVPVVGDLRQADLAAGGQGAPIVPIYHRALATRLDAGLPLAFLNIGGVANLTWIGGDDDIRAFDTGPGNGLIDLLVQRRGAGRYDDGGRLARAGAADPAVLRSLLASPFFTRSGPKSLDRYDFPLDAVAGLALENAAATLTAFTVEAIARAVAVLPEPPREWVICGGGRHNPTMMALFGQRIGRWRSADACGLRGDFIEAEAMAYLAARSLRGLPLTFPGTTGARGPTLGGRVFPPSPSG